MEADDSWRYRAGWGTSATTRAGPPEPLPIFIGLLLANGWFLGVRSFAYAPDAPPIQRRLAMAAFRLLLFVLAWIGAAMSLPPVPVALAFGAWALWVARDTHRIFGKMRDHRELTGA